MKIISGKLGGLNFISPKGHKTHPMSEKVRGALFNSLGDLDGLTVLDPFAGTGALAYEAISRGANSALVIDNDRNAQIAIEQNINTLGLSSKVRLIKASAGSWLDTTDERFDVVLLDPPYDKLQPDLLVRLMRRCYTGGAIITSLPPNVEIEMPDKLQLLKSKNYGDATLAIYRVIS